MVTRRGKAALVAAPVLLLLGVLLGYVELMVFSAALAAALVTGLAWVRRRPSLEITREVEPDRVRRGELALAQLNVRNAGRVSSPSSAIVERCGELSVEESSLSSLRPGAGALISYRLPTARRAAFDIGPLELGRSDPFGLFRTSQRQGEATRFWVHPTVHALIGSPSGRRRSLDGPDRNQVPHGSVTFHTLREYVLGDDLRHIHWRSSARFGTLMVREHVDTSLPDTTLVVDTRRSAFDDEHFEAAMEVAASVAVAVLSEGHPLRLVTSCGQEVRGQNFAGGPNAYLDVLSEVEPNEQNLAQVVLQMSLGRRGDTLVAVVGAVQDEDLAGIGALCRRFSGSVLVSVGPSTSAAPPAPAGTLAYSVADASEFAAIWNGGGGR